MNLLLMKSPPFNVNHFCYPIGFLPYSSNTLILVLAQHIFSSYQRM
nr:MAG TPA: hypothetical protein [Bacteriophage sp.]